uniref:RIN4 pathogenic type III effector avirulence factor Avr cleavage site domain-containing protein n=1 Tax=Ananas comosus var. bracteatus TaxID=296719 RepID=A0A6V7Q7L5_ANACO|nr:unnamed protein product [Ananas comosus var. bracteatus]
MAVTVSSKGGGSHGPNNTPGRSRMRGGGRGDESPEMGSTVPKFGEWDEKDPSSADNFTGIFNKVREEKQGGSAKASIINDDARYLYGSNHDNRKESSRCSCFPWFKK